MKLAFTVLLYACGLLANLATAQTSTTGSLVVGGVSRSYRLYLPPGFTPGTPAPMVINLHGYGMNAAQEELYTEMNAVADTAGFLVCYPEGIGNAWNVGFTGAYHSGVDDVAFISALIDQIYFQYQIDVSRVYACGLSNGGFMSYRLACELSPKIAAIAAVAGTMTDSIEAYCAPTHLIPVMHIHGTADQTVLYNGVPGFHWSAEATVQRWTTANQCFPPSLDTIPDFVPGDSCTVTLKRWNNCDLLSKVFSLKIENGGHTWPGTLSFPTFGHTNQDIHGSREIWEFFREFFNPEAITAIDPANQPVALTVFPNPSQGTITLQWPNHRGTGRIVCSAGRVVREFSFMEEFEAKDLPSGFYTVILQSENEQVLKAIVVCE